VEYWENLGRKRGKLAAFYLMLQYVENGIEYITRVQCLCLGVLWNRMQTRI